MSKQNDRTSPSNNDSIPKEISLEQNELDLTKEALNQSSELVKLLLQQCVFKNKMKNGQELSPKSKAAQLLSQTTQNKMSQKSGMTNAKRSKIEKLVEKDIRSGQRYKREEIEQIMKDKNFANMYADLTRYEIKGDMKLAKL